jgi:hypothetical protein
LFQAIVFSRYPIDVAVKRAADRTESYVMFVIALSVGLPENLLPQLLRIGRRTECEPDATCKEQASQAIVGAHFERPFFILRPIWLAMNGLPKIG